MADQDFNIKVVTTADTGGIRQTSTELDKLKQQQATFAETARREAAAANVPTPVVSGTAGAGAGAAGAAGLTGTAIGIGTIVTLLTAAVNKWIEFNHELDRAVENMIKSEEKMRELGESILDMQDKAIAARRLATEPLEQSFVRLQQKVIELKTQMSLLDLPRQGEEWKKLNSEVNAYQSQLNGVTSALQRQASEAKKAAQSELEKRVPGLKPQDQVKEADAQTQAILKNEQAAAKAKAEGRDADAEMFQRSADRYKASATPAQLADLQRIHDLQDKVSGKAATPEYKPLSPEEFQRQLEAAGEAGHKLTPDEMRQRQLDAQADRYQGIQRTRQESERAARDRESSNRRIQSEEQQDPELKKINDAIRQSGQGKPITEAQKQNFEVVEAIRNLENKFDRYWS